jgi:5-formyltetrahydrofolate cyclo-ligase
MDIGSGDGRDKAAMRDAMQKRVQSFDSRHARKAAQEATAKLLQLPEVESARNILICLSFSSEIGTSGLLTSLLAAGRNVFVPRSDLASQRLHIHPYPCELETLAFGLRQPLTDEPELPEEAINRTVDVAVIVGLAFDQRGYRLGYGKGFFDRFLAKRPFPAIGLAYDLQLVDKIPSEPHDVPMAAIVTELRTLRMGAPTN